MSIITFGKFFAIQEEVFLLLLPVFTLPVGIPVTYTLHLS